VLVDDEGRVIEGAGHYEHPVYVRSTIKALQALPLFESGGAEVFGFGAEEMALTMSSHNAEACHTERIGAMLERLDLGVEHLRCGAQLPGDSELRARMRASGEAPTALHNNCSGKHAGFLALARHLAIEPSTYLEPRSEVQRRVRRAVAEMCGLEPDRMPEAVDGCSAPTFRMPLAALASGFARFANPERLDPDRAAWCRNMQQAAAARPELVAGNHRRIDTDILRATKGRLFPKVGAEAVYVIGEVGAGRALAVKLDDGQLRGLHRLVLGLLERLGFADSDELDALNGWRDPIVRNYAGLEVGREEALV
jgi:L-asparaginase II